MKPIIVARSFRTFTATLLPVAALLAAFTLTSLTSLQAKEPKVTIEATNSITGYTEAPGVFTITLSEKQSKPVTVLYSIKPSQAENGIDYHRLSGVKVIKAGKVHGTIQVVPTRASDGPEGFGTVDLVLRQGKGYIVGAAKQAEVQISIVLP